mmetsp:Transcript_17823/g.29798  ORF Transcript_17823/g.29798 Transcript_17823/m.29798 type:complete len:199 (+) Transcript_17823:84-680(+)
MSKQSCHENMQENRMNSIATLPSWMRYMPNPPWKQSTNLNLQLSDNDEGVSNAANVVDTSIQDSSTTGDEGKKENEGLSSVCNSGEESEATSLNDEEPLDIVCDIDNKEVNDEKCSNDRPSKRRRPQLSSTKQKVLSSSKNPFSTSHIVLAKLDGKVKQDSTVSTSSHKKRRRLYSSGGAENLEDTAALFSFCKFSKS